MQRDEVGGRVGAELGDERVPQPAVHPHRLGAPALRGQRRHERTGGVLVERVGRQRVRRQHGHRGVVTRRLGGLAAQQGQVVVQARRRRAQLDPHRPEV